MFGNVNSVIRELLKGKSQGLLKLPTDKALVEDPEFHHYVELYANVNWLKCLCAVDNFTISHLPKLRSFVCVLAG